MPSRVRSLILSIVTSLLALVLALAAAEIALRLFRYRPPLSSEWILGNTDRLLDPDLLTIDRRFRNDSFYEPFRVPDPAKVVVCLGDSFTIGFPVDSGSSYPSVLQQMLSDRSLPVRVLNVGMGDTGPDQHLRLFSAQVLPRVTPDIVVWQFYPNDTYENAIKPLFNVAADESLTPIGAQSNWMYRRQQFFASVPLPTMVKKHSYLFHLVLRRYERDLEAQVPRGLNKLEWGRHKIELEIARMNQLARERGFRVYYTLVAPQSLYRHDIQPGSSGDNEAIEYELLRPILKKQPTFIDSRFGAATLEDNGNLGTALFADASRDSAGLGTRHLNEAGYRLLAERIANRILSDAGLPPVSKPDPAPRSTALHFQFGDPSARRIMRHGFQQDESSNGGTHVWSDGVASVLEVPLGSESDIRMVFECRPFAFAGAPEQSISIFVNGEYVNRVTLQPDVTEYSVVLPGKRLLDSPDLIEFRYTYARRPMDVIPGSRDARSLAVTWYSIDFVPSR